MTTETNGRQGYLRQGWLVIVLATAYGGALAGVHTTLAPRIAENKRQETYDVIPQLVAGADKQQTVEMDIEDTDGQMQRVYRAMDADGNLAGWVLPASGQGFADKIEVLIGLDTTLATITGMYVLSQKETPGLGDYIREPDFQDRFRNRTTKKTLVAVKSEPAADADHEIQALSGATVSSWAICDIVNKAVARLREPILREMEQ